MVGGEVAVRYLPPLVNNHQVDEILRTMSGAEVIIGDLNCCGGRKRWSLEQFIEEHQLDDIGRDEHTHKCRIDRALTTPGGRPRFFTEGWECNRDNTIVAAKYAWNRREWAEES